MKLATLVYVQHAGKTLMVLRNKKKNDMHQNKWNTLKSKFEASESPEECAIRETLEESGLTIRRPQLVGFITFPAFDDIEDWYVFVFTASEFSGDLIDSPEGDLAWIPDAELLALNIWDGDRLFMPWLNDGRGFFSAKFIYDHGRFVSHTVERYR